MKTTVQPTVTSPANAGSRANFADRLDAAVRAKGTPVLLGLDPHVELLPSRYRRAWDANGPRAARATEIADFCCELVDLAADRVAAVKPQSAFFELFGADGAVAWERVIGHARSRGLLVIADVKRADIASTAKAYADAHLAPPGEDPQERGPSARADAITIQPYLGTDALDPFVDACKANGAGAFVLVRTSNPGSARYQSDGAPTLAERVAADVVRLGESLVGACGWSSLGAVVGATHSAELAAWRDRMPRTLFLLPGYGAQGATARDIAPAFRAGSPSGALVASSRGIAFAYRTGGGDRDGSHWRDAADRALDTMIQEIARALDLRTGGL